MKSKVIGEKEVIEKFGVKPSQVVDVQSLAGDFPTISLVCPDRH